MKIIQLPCYDIKIIISDSGISQITSSLKEKGNIPYNNCIDGVESLILAHASAGIDVLSPPYLEGIEVAVEAALNNC